MTVVEPGKKWIVTLLGPDGLVVQRVTAKEYKVGQEVQDKVTGLKMPVILIRPA